MPLVMQLHNVMMSKYSKFGVDTFYSFWVMGYIKAFAWQQQRRRRSNYHNSLTQALHGVTTKIPNMAPVLVGSRNGAQEWFILS